MLFSKKKKAKEVPAQRIVASEPLEAVEIERQVKELLAADAHPVEGVLNLLISQAILHRASDIHFEPHRNAFSVKYRVDGALLPVVELPSLLQEGCLIRMKVLSNLIVYKRDIPQDGNIKVAGTQSFGLRHFPPYSEKRRSSESLTRND